MEVVEMLDNLKEKARKDPALREELLATREEKEPLAAFCKKCRELGVPVYEMDLIAAGEEFYAAMKRSTNGGGRIHRCLKVKMIFMNCFLQGCDVYLCLKIFTTQNVRSIFRQGFFIYSIISIYFSSTGNCIPPIFSTLR